MSLVTVKSKYQVVIPANVRKATGIEVGDVLEASVKNGKVTFTPKTVIEGELAEGLEDIRKGRVYGPFETADEMIESLKGKLVKKQRSSGAKRASR